LDAIIYSILKRNSPCRALQKIEARKFELYGNSLEFGNVKFNNKSFFNDFKLNKKNKIFFSDIIKIKRKNYFMFDLEKKNNLKKKFDNIIIFNVLEHIYETDNAFTELKKLLKPKGKIYISTPFLYRYHSAPKDYYRFTLDFYEKIAKKQKIKWVEDPSNLNLNFDRIKIRNSLQNFYDSGFDKKLFLKSINKLKSINDDIDFIAESYASKYIEVHENIFVSIRKEFFINTPNEIQMRIVKNCIRLFAPDKLYSPKDIKIINLLKWMKKNSNIKAKTLGGTLFKKNTDEILLYKEVKNLNRIKSIDISKSEFKCWDNRFLIKANKDFNGKISYLGPEGVKVLKSKKIDINKAKKNAPIAAVYSSPAIWNKKRLISAPIFDYSINNKVNIEIKKIDICSSNSEKNTYLY